MNSRGPAAKGLISERTVREVARTGRALEIAKGTIVTPAARDLARQLGIALVVSGDKAAPTSITVVIGADHGGFRLKESLKPVIAELGFSVTDVGCASPEPVDYPVYAARVAEHVAAGSARFGVMVDGAGIGSAMVANKIAGVRAASCPDPTTAKSAREHNDANVLTLGGGLTGERLAAEIVRTFLATPFAGGRHQKRVAMIQALDREPGVRSGVNFPAP